MPEQPDQRRRLHADGSCDRRQGHRRWQPPGGQLNRFVSAANNGSCYSCLNTAGLDDNAMDTGNECADSPTTAGGSAACLATLSCIIAQDCQGPGGIAGTADTTSQENVNLCYCGGNNPGSACSATAVSS